MAAPATDETTQDRLIVIHPPLTGDPEKIQAFEAAHTADRATTEIVVVEAGPKPTVRQVGSDVPIASVDQPAAAPEIEGTHHEPVSTAPAKVPRERALSLDTFRGLYLLMMNFAFGIPAVTGVYPDWMYHQQYPAPGETHMLISGLTWRDLLYPGFLFSMAAAIPVTNSLRIARGMSYPSVLFGAIKRGFMLFVFALIIGHVNPFWTQDYTKRGNLVSIFGFLLCFLLFTRERDDWNPKVVNIVRKAGWIITGLFLFVVYPYMYGQGFSPKRQDDIIVSIAFCSIAGTAIWLATRYNIKARIGIALFILALRTAAQYSGWEWAENFWNASPATWLYESWFLELLMVVIPGLIAGDLLVRWMRAGQTTETETPAFGPSRQLAIIGVTLAVIPVAVGGLYKEHYVTVATVLILAIAALGLFLTRGARLERERVIAAAYRWSAFLLALGILTESTEGGMKKDPQTLSYLFFTTGVSMGVLLALTILLDMRKQGRTVLKPVLEVGQNPLMGYIVYMLFFNQLLYLIGEHVGAFLSANWQQAVLRSICVVGMVGVTVWFFTKQRIFWRT